MRLRLNTTLTALSLTAFSFVPNFADAQALPCGNIIEPTNINVSTSPLKTTAVIDCLDPFKVDTDPVSPYTLKVNNVAYPNAGTVPVPDGRTNQISVDGKAILSGYKLLLYKHDGNDYRYVPLQAGRTTKADYVAYATTYFSDSSDRILYLEIYDAFYGNGNADSYFYEESGDSKIDATTGKTIRDRFFEFLDSYEKPDPYIESGTYTLLIKEFQLFYNKKNILERFVDLIIPTAYAVTNDQGYPEYRYTITFTIAPETSVPTGASSVLFLPGIQSSLLYKDGIAGTEDQIWTPDGNQDVRQLAMNSLGVSQNQVYTKSLMATIPLGGTVYDSFARSMVNLVQDNIIKGWTPFAYDWRYSVEEIAINGTKYEHETRKAIDEIQYLASSSFTGKVTIIGHSNGGLLAKVIMKKLAEEGKTNLVDKVVLLASPQLGTPKAIGTILHGFDQEKLGGWIIDDVTSRDVIQNMPGAYGLVPSQRYVDSTGDKIIRFENSSTTQFLRSAYGDSIDSEGELKRFMLGTSDNRAQATTIDEILRANDLLLTQQLNLHNTSLDTWVAPANVQVVEIVGTGLDTVSGFEYRGFTERVCILGVFSCSTKNIYKPVPLISQNGDKTVMGQSAEGYVGDKVKYFIDLKRVADIKVAESVEHYNISENPSIQKLIKNILLATSTDIEFISSSNSYASGNRVLLGVHSPAEIEVVDTAGKRVGKKITPAGVTKEEAIIGSSYFEIGSSKYVIVPANSKYSVKLKGTAEGGLTFSLDKLNSSAQIPEISVRVATITASTSVKLSYDNSALSNLEIDLNGDGVTDTVLTPQGIDVTPKITYKILKDKINSLQLTSVRKLPLLLLVEAADILDKKSATNPKLIPTELFTLNQLESLLTSYQSKGWISQSTLNDLKVIINKLK